MKKFEYKMQIQANLATYTIDDIERDLNYEGRDGWELCAIDWGCLIFKREIPQE